MDEQLKKNFYDAKVSVYKNSGKNSNCLERTALKMFPKTPGLKVLDYGCGSGHFLHVLKEMGCDVTGVDISPNAVQKARESGVTAVVGNAETKEGFKNLAEIYDVIIMLDVLEHTFDPAMVLTNLAELLRSGGCIIASVPNIGCVVGRATILAGRFPSAQCGLFDFGHIRWFTKSSLMRLICGMKQFVLSDWQGTTIPAVSKMGLWRTERLQTWLLKLLARHWSSMWGYQLVFRIDLLSSKE